MFGTNCAVFFAAVVEFCRNKESGKLDYGYFLHPTNGNLLEADIGDSLIANFLPDNSARGGYRLLIKDNDTVIDDSEMAASAWFTDGTWICVWQFI